MGFLIVLLVLFLTLSVVGIFGLVKSRDRGKRTMFDFASLILGVSGLALTLFCYELPAPEIYPIGGQLTKDSDAVTIKGKSFTRLYYTFDEYSDITPDHGNLYDGNPIHFRQSSYIGARAYFLLWHSEIKSVFITTYEDSIKRYGMQVGNTSEESDDSPMDISWSLDSQVSENESLDYDSLPDGLRSGWGDSEGGRRSYTIDEINRGLLGNQIVFNSISDSVSGNEKNFVVARPIDASNDQPWNANLIEVHPGKRYKVRLYGHNNSLYGYGSCAEHVEAAFMIPEQSGKSIVVHGLIRSANAVPDLYWDGVVFTSDERFGLRYVRGSAIIKNNGIGSGGLGYSLPDEIVNGWQSLGYQALDGVVPGCYQYSFYLSIEVDVVAA